MYRTVCSAQWGPPRADAHDGLAGRARTRRGQATRSCIVLVDDVAGRNRKVRTLEGLADDPRMTRLQDAFIAERAMQCGYCIPGMLVAARALLGEEGHTDRADIAAGLEGNVCRCGTYPRILRAVEQASGRRTSGGPERGERSQGGGATETGHLVDIVDPPRPRRPWDLTDPDGRDFFEILGDGLVAVLSPEETGRIGPEPAWSTEGGAWLHVSPDGRVTAFTGKVDVGQDNHTALRMIVAGQLEIPVGAVDLVMGDTDLCPADIGTFGSRSTTDAGQVLALCAAAAREALARSPLRSGERRLISATAGERLVGPAADDRPLRSATTEIVDGTRRDCRTTQ